MTDRIFPNLFIVGAPKSGTTALAHYLSQHPSVYFSKRKELHYLCPSIDYHYRIREINEYIDQFRHNSGEKWIAEGSVWYLYSTDAACNIYYYQPNAKIIIMLRNPADMLASLHAQYIWNGYEQIDVFEDALCAEADRRFGFRFPPRAIMNKAAAPAGLVYWDACRYAQQVRRFLDIFRTKQIKFILYENFSQNPEGTFHDVCDFLEISKEIDLNFLQINYRKSRRSQALHQFLNKPSPMARRIFGTIPGTAPVKNALKRFNEIRAKTAISEGTREWILSEYVDDINELAVLTDLPVKKWLCEPK